MNDLVSIIIPNYNREKTISQAIESVLSQSYQNWEMIIVDDCSTDQSPNIIQSFAKKDTRIKFIRMDYNSGGPATPTNEGLKIAQGRFIAFLDSDDQWLPSKLEEQIPLFDDPKVSVVFSNYEKISTNGDRLNRVITAPKSVTYKQLLKGDVIGNSTGVYDTKKSKKIPVMKIGAQDYEVWLTALRGGFIAKNTEKVHVLYRTVSNSCSSNKFKSALWTWKIYYEVEKIPLLSSLYYFIHYSIKSTIKLLK